MRTIDPTSGRKIKNYPEFSLAKIEGILEKTQKSFMSWRKQSVNARAVFMKRAAKILRSNKEQYARLMALEMGKPFDQGINEIEKCALVCDFYVEHAAKYLSDKYIKTQASKSFIAYEPLGIVLAVMPWNFPFWQVFRCAIPTLMAGNAVVLKHASNVGGCALAIEKVFKEAGLPPFLFSNIYLSGSRVKNVIQHPFIQAVSLTGSTAAGKSIAATAGAEIKKVVLELGGSDPYIVLEDADINQAVITCVNARMINGGQSCVAAKRFIIVASRFKEFEEKFVSRMQLQQMGPPLHEGITLGPMARHDLRDQLHAQVQQSVKQGAKILLGGIIPPGPGAFYPATVLSHVHPGMVAFRQELFGPVAALIKAKDEVEAVKMANDTVFGLGAALFTKNLAKAQHLAKEIQAGSLFINEAVRSDPYLPFGGIKQSGYGRELSEAGIREFVNIKTIVIK